MLFFTRTKTNFLKIKHCLVADFVCVCVCIYFARGNRLYTWLLELKASKSSKVEIV